MFKFITFFLLMQVCDIRTMLVDLNIDLIIGFGISSSSNMFNTFVSTIIFLYLTCLDFNQLSHIITTSLHTYNNLQMFISSTGGCELWTKCIAIVSFNDSNDDSKAFKSSLHFQDLVQNLLCFLLVRVDLLCFLYCYILI